MQKIHSYKKRYAAQLIPGCTIFMLAITSLSCGLFSTGPELLNKTGSLQSRDETLRTGEYTDKFTVTAEADRPIEITVSSQEFDAYVIVVPVIGEELENDNALGTDAQLVYTPSESGEIDIYVTSASPGEVGSYSLSVIDLQEKEEDEDEKEQDSFRSNSALNESGRLEKGDETLQSGELIDWYDVEAEAGQELEISTYSDDFDTYLLVLTPDGEQHDADDVESDLNAALSIQIFQSGTVEIGVTSAYPGEFGDYSLEVNSSGSSGQGHRTDSDNSTASSNIADGDYLLNVSGELNAQDERLSSGEFIEWIDFSVSEAGRYQITLSSSDFDSYLLVMDPQDNQFDNDDADGSNSQLNINTQGAGTFEIGVTTYEAKESGGFTLTVRLVSELETLQIGKEQRGSIEQSDERFIDSWADWYSFEGTEGQGITINLQSREMDTFLYVRDQWGNTDQNDDISESNYNSQISYTFPSSGSIEICATSYDADTTGPYSIEITSGIQRLEGQDDPVINTADSQSLGQQETIRGRLERGDLELDSGEYYDSYEFSASEGQVVEIDMTSDRIDTYLILIEPSGEQIDIDDSDGTSNSYLEHILVESGTYEILCTSYGPGETGAYNLEYTLFSREEFAEQDESSTGVGSSSGYYGIFIGISDYPGSDSDLDWCDEDAQNLAQVFRDTGIMTSSQQRVLTNNQATVANIREAIDQYANSLGRTDNLVLFYSGHGDILSSSSERDNQDETLSVYDGEISDDELASMLRPMDGRVILAIDACYSGGFQKDVITEPGWIGIFSSEEDVLSNVADKFEAGGYLSFFLQNAVRGEADSVIRQDQAITMGELEQYLFRQWYSERGPDPRDHQNLVFERNGVEVEEVLFWLE